MTLSNGVDIGGNDAFSKSHAASQQQTQAYDQIFSWNSEIPDALESCVTEIIAAWAHKDPDAEAVCSWDGSLTYAELDELSSRLAAYLTTEGVGPEVLVTLCFEKSKWVVVSLIAVLKAGGAFVLLDPSSPLARLSGMVHQTKGRLALSSSEQLDTIAPLVDNVIVVDADRLSGLPLASATWTHRASPRNTAYVIFTSGSTGEPKGVVIEHSQLATSCVLHGVAEGFLNRPRVLQFASYTWDVCIRELVTTLVHGGTICIPSEWERKNDLLGVMTRTRVTCGSFTPSLVSGLDLGRVETLDTLLLGGETTPPSVLKTWAPKLRLILSYGPSECTVTSAVLDTSVQTTHTVGDIGRAVGCRNWIVQQDDVNVLADIGAVGELVIEGPIVARGYLGDTEKTKSRFIQAPAWMAAFKGDTCRRESRFYRTGDLVKYNHDGSILYVGRLDNQVKIRGQRLELGEVEVKLEQCISGMEQLEAAHVLVEAITPLDRPGSKVLIAMLCLEGSEAVGYLDWHRQDGALPVTSDVERQRLARVCIDIEERLRLQLPVYALPTFYIPLKSIPLTLSGKANRRQLRSAIATLCTKQLADFTMVRDDSSISAEMPPSPNEDSLRSIWARIFDIETAIIESSDNFFGLGGDSVLAIRLVSEVRIAGLALTVETIFRHPVLSDMARAASKISCDDKVGFELPPFSLLGEAHADIRCEAIRQCGITDDLIEDIYPCSPMQTGLFYQSVRHAGAYIMQIAYSLPLSLDVARFQAAWNAVVLENPILRARFIEDSSGLFQVIVKGTPQICIEEGRALDNVLLEEKAVRMSHGQPLSRLTLLWQSDPPSLHLIWTIHHSITDGWTSSIIEKLVEKYYFSSPRAISQGPNFNTFVQHVSQLDTERAQIFWRAHLDGAPAPSFPSRLSPNDLPAVIRCLDHDVPLTHSGSVTAATAVQAAWTLLAGMYSNSTDVVTGVTLNGRTAPILQIDNIAGPTITTVPFRTNFTKDQLLTDLLNSIQKQYLDIIPFQHLGLHNIRRQNEGAYAAYNFPSILAIHSTTGDKPRRIFLERKTSFSNLDCALFMECELRSNGVNLRATFDDNILSEVQMRRILEQFAHLIRKISAAAGDKSVKVSDVEGICDADLKQIMKWNNDGVPPKPTEACVHELFEQRAQSQPTAPAVCAWDGGLSYEALDRCATQLATHLITDYGVGPESMVPVCFEKSLWYVVSALAVMKAGGAWVPMDPKHPPSRMRTIIDRLGDNCAGLILTSNLNAESLVSIGLRILVIDSALLESMAGKEDSKPLHKPSPQNLCNVVFTSGSTGTPKGILVEHRSLSTSLIENGAFIRLGMHSRVLQFSTHTFDMSTEEIFATLLHGGCVCIPSEHDRMNNLAGAIAAMKVNHAILTPAVASQMEPRDVPSLKTLIVGGEPLPRKLIEDWADRVTLFNIYGPSECTIYCTGKPDLRRTTEPSHIGRGVGAIVWIADPEDYNKLVPIGSVGELLIEGAGVTRGYLGNEAQTRAAFVENPAWATAGGATPPRRLYRTGDLVCYNPDGSIAILGRNDGQIKLHGQRIEIGEVEHQLKEALLDSMDAAVCIVTPDGGRSVLVAFVACGIEKHKVMEPRIVRSKAGLRRLQAALDGVQDRMRSVLPGYMVPDTFLPVSCLPLSASGKIDRKKLQAMASELSSEGLSGFRGSKPTQCQPLRPSTPMEKALQTLWQQLLQLPDVGLDDNFFRLGGDSVIAMRLVALAKKQGMDITVEQIFEKPVLVDLALAASCH